MTSNKKTKDCQETEPSVASLIDVINASTFKEWYQEHKRKESLQKGRRPWKTGTHPPQKHRPSELVQCHRKVFYRQSAAPEERPDPEGILWTGAQFEEEFIVPYLSACLAETNYYVRNSIWVDYTIPTNAGELTLQGATDPVIVDSNGRPLLLTEVKTKRSFEHLEKVQTHHRAQTHAYLYGLSQKDDWQIADAVILYGNRQNFQIKPFHISFDPSFWNVTVIEWAKRQTEFHLNAQLPPPTPEYEWECRFCQYRKRCGKGESYWENIGPDGFLPLNKYPKEKVIVYLKKHHSEESKLMPSLAHLYPELARQYSVFDWHCPVCSTTYEWTQVEWDCDFSNPPPCNACLQKRDTPIPLRGPHPANQLQK